ncbi:unnamed protein product [Adineta steineri]|uniref:Tubulin-tyrosine ligase family protein n=1 Tax=Adineta steineri TaxID=433720 RepID=A0A814NKK9_9BILA|nr:unnamed protein product [Adineta steineri]
MTFSTTFDDLPDLILIEIFSYLSSFDTLWGFTHLNQHIASLLVERKYFRCVNLSSAHYFQFNKIIQVISLNNIESLSIDVNASPLQLSCWPYMPRLSTLRLKGVREYNDLIIFLLLHAVTLTHLTIHSRLEFKSVIEMLEENSSNLLSNEIKPRKNSNKKSRSSLYPEPKPVCYIGSGNNSHLIENILKSIGYENNENKIDDFKFKWVQSSSNVNWNIFKDGEQMINHIQGEDYFTNKLQLYQSLQTYETNYLSLTKRPQSYLTLNQFIPQTFKLDEIHDRHLLFNLHKPGDIWICKPSGLNQGKGIYIVKDINQLKEKFNQEDLFEKPKTFSIKQIKTIVQRYIMNPLLVHGKKFDIRCYMLISSVKPLIVLYHHGYIRLSMFDFDNDDENLLTHLTNQFVQKKDPKYNDMKEETAWTMEQLNDYVNEYILPRTNIQIDWIKNILPKIICRIMLNVIESIRMRLKERIGCFGLYGCDFMIDENMKVWLIEINVNPSLSTNTNTLLQVIPAVVQEAILISIECFEKIHHNHEIFPLKSLNGFVCIYNDLERKSSFPSIKQKSHHYSNFDQSQEEKVLINEKKVSILKCDNFQRSRTNNDLLKTSKYFNEKLIHLNLKKLNHQTKRRSKSVGVTTKSSSKT